MYLYGVLDSISMVLNIHNVASAAVFLVTLGLSDRQGTLAGLGCCSIAWLLTSCLAFDKAVLPSFFLYGYTFHSADQVEFPSEFCFRSSVLPERRKVKHSACNSALVSSV